MPSTEHTVDHKRAESGPGGYYMYLVLVPGRGSQCLR